jgi:hypothetical protein
VFVLTATCSASCDVLCALLTVERPPEDSVDAFDFNAVLHQASYWAPQGDFRRFGGRVLAPLSSDEDAASVGATNGNGACMAPG